MSPQRGSTLVGILVGLVISSFILAALLAALMFTSNNQIKTESYQINTEAKKRFLMNFSQNHLTQAGYLEPTYSLYSVNVLSGAAIEGSENLLVTTGNYSDTLTYRLKPSDSTSFYDCLDNLLTDTNATSSNALVSPS